MVKDLSSMHEDRHAIPRAQWLWLVDSLEGYEAAERIQRLRALAVALSEDQS